MDREERVWPGPMPVRRCVRTKSAFQTVRGSETVPYFWPRRPFSVRVSTAVRTVYIPNTMTQRANDVSTRVYGPSRPRYISDTVEGGHPEKRAKSDFFTTRLTGRMVGVATLQVATITLMTQNVELGTPRSRTRLIRGQIHTGWINCTQQKPPIGDRPMRANRHHS